MNASDLRLGKFFTTDGTDIWELGTYFDGPSCTLENLKTGDKETFGMGGLTAQRFKEVIMPEGQSNG